MRRERILKVVFVFLGLLFCAAVYPLLWMLKGDPALSMMMSLYATLGIFLLLASRNPYAHRSLIAFTAWSSFAHAGVMSFQALHDMIAPQGTDRLCGARWYRSSLNRAGSDQAID